MKLKYLFLSKEKREQVENNQFYIQKNIDESLKILEDTIEVLNMHQIDYYLDFGTLLGAIRDKALIPWDNDIDISILNEEDYFKIPEVLKDVRKKGYGAWVVKFYRTIINRKIKLKKEKLDDIYVDFNDIHFTDLFNYRMAEVRNKRKRFLRKKYKKGKNSMDIFFKYEKDGKLYWMAENRVHQLDSNALDRELIEIDFYHLKCKVPKNYEEYLTYIYGDWKTPHKDWTEDDAATDVVFNTVESKK